MRIRAYCINKMFEAKLDGIFLKKLAESLKEICIDVNIECDCNGMEMQAMDNSHVALVHLFLSCEFFEYYRCDKPLVLGLNIPHLLKVLLAVKDGHQVILQKDEDPNDTLLKIHIDEAETERLNVELKLIDMEKEHLQVPDQIYMSTAILPSKKFQESIKYLNNIAETVSISMTNEKLFICGEGQEAKLTKQFCQAVDSDEVMIDCKEEVTQEFACRVLNLFSRAASLSPTVKICQAAGIPLAVKFDIFRKDNEKSGQICFFLAPKIEE